MPIHIVLWDNEPDVARMISCRLMRADFEVHSVHDCESGWDVIRRVRPHLLITDLEFPALELVCRVRSTPETCALPVIVLTGAKGDSALYERLQHELNLFAVLPKPFSPRQLVRLAAAATHRTAAFAPAV